MLLKILAIFLAGALTDFLVARYTRAVHEKKPLFAAWVTEDSWKDPGDFLAK